MKHFINIVLITLGTISLILGIIGLFLPLIPTTPFLLLTAACYVRGSEKLYNRLISNKYFGTHIRNYREGKGMPMKSKIYAISLLWIGNIFSAVFIIPYIHAKIALIIIATLVTFYISNIKTLEDKS